MPKAIKQQELIIFKGTKGQVKLRGDFRNDTMWATLDQIAAVFGRDKSVIFRHLSNIFKDGELVRNSVVAKNATTASDGKTYQVEYYNLDAIISVGYRVNSKTATQFRQWATKTLREHITKGFTINPARIGANREAFLSAVEQVRKMLPSGGEVGTDAVLDIVTLFADTWFSLDAYDKEALSPKHTSKKKVSLTATALEQGIAQLKATLMVEAQPQKTLPKLATRVV